MGVAWEGLNISYQFFLLNTEHELYEEFLGLFLRVLEGFLYGQYELILQLLWHCPESVVE